MTQSEAAILAARRDRVKPESSHLNVKEEEGAGVPMPNLPSALYSACYYVDVLYAAFLAGPNSCQL